MSARLQHLSDFSRHSSDVLHRMSVFATVNGILHSSCCCTLPNCCLNVAATVLPEPANPPTLSQYSQPPIHPVNRSTVMPKFWPKLAALRVVPSLSNIVRITLCNNEMFFMLGGHCYFWSQFRTAGAATGAVGILPGWLWLLMENPFSVCAPSFFPVLGFWSLWWVSHLPAVFTLTTFRPAALVVEPGSSDHFQPFKYFWKCNVLQSPRVKLVPKLNQHWCGGLSGKVNDMLN